MRYVVGEDYLCLFAILEIVLKDIGIYNYDQYELANYFGVTLPSNYYIKGVTNITIGKEMSEYGAHINQIDMCSFFMKKGIPLNTEYIHANPFGEYENAKYIEKKKYVIYQYSYGSLYHEPKNDSVGHASLLVANEKNGRIRIYDPGPRNYGEKEVEESKMLDAVYDIRGGIFVLSLITEESFA